MTALFIAMDLFILAAIGFGCWAIAQRIRRRPVQVHVRHNLELFHDTTFLANAPLYEKTQGKAEQVNLPPIDGDEEAWIDDISRCCSKGEDAKPHGQADNDLAMRTATPFVHGGIGAPDSTSFFNF